jgi:hypothetical protein
LVLDIAYILRFKSLSCRERYKAALPKHYPRSLGLSFFDQLFGFESQIELEKHAREKFERENGDVLYRLSILARLKAENPAEYDKMLQTYFPESWLNHHRKGNEPEIEMQRSDWQWDGITWSREIKQKEKVHA